MAYPARGFALHWHTAALRRCSPAVRAIAAAPRRFGGHRLGTGLNPRLRGQPCPAIAAAPQRADGVFACAVAPGRLGLARYEPAPAVVPAEAHEEQASSAAVTFKALGASNRRGAGVAARAAARHNSSPATSSVVRSACAVAQAATGSGG